MKKTILTAVLMLVTATYLASLSAATPRELPLPEVPSSITDAPRRADFIISHFWDALDFNSDETSDPTFIELNFVNYLSLFPHTLQDSLQTRVNSFMDKASSNPGFYRLLYDMGRKYLGQKDSPMRDDKSLILFLDHASRSGTLGEAETERAAYVLEMVSKNLPGTTAPDFKFISLDGSPSTLSSSLGNGKNILMFYNPDCDHCMEAIDRLTAANLPSDVRVIAIDTEEDRSLWDSTKTSMPEQWVIGFATDPIQDSDIYVIDETPTLFLLDADMKIILKEPTTPQILDKVLQ